MRFPKRPYLKDVLAETVVVHAGERSIEGILIGCYADTIVLVHAAVLGADGRVVVDGEVLIPWPLPPGGFIQRLGAPAEGRSL